MATRFEHNGNLFEIITGTDEVVLVRIPQSSKGEIVLPKYAMYGDKRYTVTQIGGIKEPFYKWDEDKRKKSGGEYKYDRDAHPCLLNKRSYVIDNAGLAEASNITSLFIPDGVKRIGNCAFSGCCKGMKKLTIPDSVVSIGYSAFWGCENLESLTVPDSVITIGHTAFYACHSLKKLVLSKKVKEINHHTFWSDKNEVKVSIPSSVEVIGEWAFSRKLQTVDIYNDMGEVLVAGNAFPEGTKINYLGKKSMPKESSEKVSKTTKKEETKEPKVAAKTKTTAAKIEAKTTKKEETKTPKTATAKKEEPKATTKTATAKKETTAKSKSKDSSVKYGKYEITVNEDKSVSVTLKGTLCDNTKEALREVATAAKFKVDDKWSTRQLGAKLVAFLSEK